MTAAAITRRIAQTYQSPDPPRDEPGTLRTTYPTASIVGDERVVFNIRGNNYRLVVAINYPAKIVYIKFFGTHAEYDKIDVKQVQP